MQVTLIMSANENYREWEDQGFISYDLERSNLMVGQSREE